MSSRTKGKGAKKAGAKPASAQWISRRARKWLLASGEALESGDAREAEAIAREGIERVPESPELHAQLAATLIAQDNLDGARECAENLVRLQPGSAGPLVWLAEVCEAKDELEPAMDALERALTIEPASADYWNRLGLLNLGAGLADRGAECFRQAFRHDEMLPGVTLNLSRAKDFERADDPDLALIERALAAGGGPPEHRSDVRFAMAKAMEDLGDHVRAFEHYREANALVRDSLRQRGEGFDRERHARGVDRLIETFDADLVHRLADAGWGTGEPVFIVGMPRSGTTLVEQILASHFMVFGAGELPLLDQISRGMRAYLGASENYPRCVRELDGPTATQAGIEYANAIEAIAPDVSFVTDKMPSNFMHLGLAEIILPESTKIHVKRNAMDTCASVYTTQFGTGHNWAYDLGDIAFYYREYERLMAHWNEVLLRPPFQIEYEALVANQEKWSRALVSHLDIEWDEACLQFHRTERRVGTASDIQVRQPMYRSSVERWRRYEAELEPLRAALEDGV